MLKTKRGCMLAIAIMLGSAITFSVVESVTASDSRKYNWRSTQTPPPQNSWAHSSPTDARKYPWKQPHTMVPHLSQQRSTRVYVGAVVGHTMAKHEMKDVSLGPAIGDTDLSGTGMNGGIVLGLSKRLGSGRIGIELEGSRSSIDASANVSIDGTPQDISLKITSTYGVSVIGGMDLSPSTMLYARIGWVQSEFEAEANVTSFSTNFVTEDDTEQGFRSGIGIQTDLNQHLALRGEYLYTKYSSFQSIDPSTGVFRLGLIYNF